MAKKKHKMGFFCIKMFRKYFFSTCAIKMLVKIVTVLTNAKIEDSKIILTAEIKLAIFTGWFPKQKL